MKENGVVSESSYPYMNKAGSCVRSQKGSPVAYVKDFKRLDGEDTFPEAMATYGPMGVSLLVDGDGWYKYSSGVYSGPCGDGGHAVNIVGYGTDNGQAYWIIKNSWGPGWGDKGKDCSVFLLNFHAKYKVNVNFDKKMTIFYSKF